MTRTIIPAAPALPFSKAIITKDTYTMEISGQVGINPATGKLEEGIRAQTIQTIENVKTILQSVGWNLENLTKVRIFLTDMNNYTLVNEIYATQLKHDFPTRVALAVKELPFGALIELDCTASGDHYEKQ